MQLSDLFDKISKNNLPLILGGVVVGGLGVWVLGKITFPLIDPRIKSACRSYLEIDATGQSLRERDIPNIEAERIEKGTMTKRVNTVGLLKANTEVMLRSETAGRIKEVKFREGETVNEGDLLIQFEDADVKAELEDAQADLKNQKEESERQASLLQHGHITKLSKAYNEARNNYDRAKARVDKAQATLEKTKIIAPFTGTIGLIKVDTGEYVQPNAELVKLVDYTPMKVDFKVPEKYLSEIGVGQQGELKLDAFPGETFIFNVDAIDSSVDPLTHSIAVRGSIPNENGKLRSGLYANISLIIGEQANTLMIPESAIIRDGEVEYVWVIVNGKAAIAKVITGTRENAKVEIIGGPLREGMMVVKSGQIKLVNGSPVNITNQPNPVDLLKQARVDEAPAEVKTPEVNVEEKASEKAAEPKIEEKVSEEAPEVKVEVKAPEVKVEVKAPEKAAEPKIEEKVSEEAPELKVEVKAPEAKVEEKAPEKAAEVKVEEKK